MRETEREREGERRGGKEGSERVCAELLICWSNIWSRRVVCKYTKLEQRELRDLYRVYAFAKN